MTSLMPTRVGGTRWLPHLHKAVDHFLRGYAAFISHLQKVCHFKVLYVSGTAWCLVLVFWCFFLKGSPFIKLVFFMNMFHNIPTSST